MQQSDGSFAGDEWLEIDTRFSYCAVATLALLGGLDRINIEKAIEFIQSCRNLDGGFGLIPETESHSGQIFCCVAALDIISKHDPCKYSLQTLIPKSNQLCWFLAERQLPNGGLNGRPEKLEDVCYSFWTLSSLCILKKSHWISNSALQRFIYSCQVKMNQSF